MTKSSQHAQEARFHELIMNGTLTRRQGMTAITFTDRNLMVVTLNRISKTMRQLTQSDALTYRLVGPSRNNDGWQIVASNEVGAKLMGLIREAQPSFKQLFPKHELHPWVKLFFDLVLPLKDQGWLTSNSIQSWASIEMAQQALRCWNALVEDFRYHARQPDFQQAIRRFRKSARKSERSMLAYKDALFKRDHRLLVIRLDLSYQHDPSEQRDVTDRMDIRLVKRHKGQFLKYLNRRFGAALKGFIWKIEFGWCKGFHHHILVFLDARHHREDVTIGREVGEVWERDITQGSGLYYNCNAFKRQSALCGLGEVNYSDLETMTGLNTAISYLCKTDYLVRGVLPKGMRVVTRGGRPRMPCQRRGRKRSKMAAQPVPPALMFD